jgi:hypothetical protein
MSDVRRRVAVVLDGPLTPRWQQAALAAIAASPALEIVAVRLAEGRRRGLIRRAHGSFERHLFALGPDALEPVPAELGDLAPRSPSAPAEDLLVWLSEQPPPIGEHAELLYLRHAGIREPAEEAFRRATLRGRRDLETEVLLSGPRGTLLVARTVSAARPYSTTLSRDKALWKIAALVARAAERAPGLDVAAAPSAPTTAAPSTAELILRAPRAWLHVVLARLLFDRRWQVRVREHAADPVAGWPQARRVVRWKPGHLYADPFLFAHEGRHHLFCEDMPPGANRAVISHTELDLDGGLAAPPEPVLEAPYHLSYPFVLAHGAELFMIPETSAEQRVELYRAVEFPHVWRREAVLLEGLAASDATLLAHEGRLWLFVCVGVPHATMLDELHLFTAESPRGPWVAHARNPVVSDVRCARPAGAIQRWGPRLIRPGQDGSRRYGGAISFREIDVLSLEDYAEHEVARLEPADLGRARATHTYAADGRFEAVDLRERELRPRLRSSLLARALRRS